MADAATGHPWNTTSAPLRFLRAEGEAVTAASVTGSPDPADNSQTTERSSDALHMQDDRPDGLLPVPSVRQEEVATAANRPRLLDLFCGAGGAAMGYHRAGFDVVGIDSQDQPHYPFTFLRMDAIEALDMLTMNAGLGFGTPLHLADFDAIHASPPCQDHMLTPHRKHGTGWLLPATRDLLVESELPWVIENVPGAPMRADFRICGCQVGLELRRERWFETSWHHFALAEPHNHPHAVPSVVGHGTPSWVREQLGYNPTIADYRACMGIDWMNRDELSQAIPPAYTEIVGRALLAHVRQDESFRRIHGID